MHRNGARIVNRICDATVYQRYFLGLMAAEDINYRNSIETRLTGIAKGVGVEFSNSSSSERRSSNSFRERIKRRQERNRLKEEVKDG